MLKRAIYTEPSGLNAAEAALEMPLSISSKDRLHLVELDGPSGEYIMYRCMKSYWGLSPNEQ